MSEIILTGLISNLEGESRALANIEVNHNDAVYSWQVFIPNYVDNVSDFLESIKQSVLDDIDSKELTWNQMDPKTRPVSDPFTNQIVEIPISKEEIVKPSIPDYYALRRNEYPSLGDQLDAMWKGINSQDFIDMQAKISAVKVKYPKP